MGHPEAKPLIGNGRKIRRMGHQFEQNQLLKVAFPVPPGLHPPQKQPCFSCACTHGDPPKKWPWVTLQTNADSSRLTFTDCKSGWKPREINDMM